MAKVSIIIPTHDRPDLLLGRAVPSVLGQQTKHEIELIVVGDDTDEDSIREMRDLAARDPRVHFWNLPKQPLPDGPEAWNVIGLQARNWGHDQATGTYVGGLDDDDEFTPDHIEVLVRAIEWNDVDWAYGMSKAFVKGRTRLYGHQPPGSGALCDGAGLWKRELGYRYDPDCLKRGKPEDGDLWDRMREDGVKWWFVPQVVHHYYPNPGGGSYV